MKKETIIVPRGIRFISEWNNFEIPDFPCIIDKKIPGCGFTEYCITNNENIILCSPRKLLLENKENQHEKEVLYVKNELDQDSSTDKNLEKITRGSTIAPTKLSEITPEEQRKLIIKKLKEQINQYISDCQLYNKPIKILVTYDSFRLVKETLGEYINKFRVVIDEFQSIFTDSRFKSTTELDFIYYLQDIDKLCFVSATPMIDEYLEQLDEFKDLPYFELDWKTDDPNRVLTPDLKVKICRSINEISYKIISEYINGNFESYSYKDELDNIQTIYSREAVFYINSVSNIIGIINKCNLQPEQCNILIARTPDNEKKLKRRLGRKWEIGKIPLLGEEHKMFTFCTRTVYLGADFYSTNARTFILSDATIETLSVDISLDLPQILGRQRLKENPWKNRAEFYYKTNGIGITQEKFKLYLDNKIDKTKRLLKAYSETSEKQTLAEKYRKDTVTSNYKDDYIAVNEHKGNNLVPCLNKLVMLAEQRSFEIQQIDYKDRFSVFNTLKDQSLVDMDNNIVQFLEQFDSMTIFKDKMKYLCESKLSENEINVILDQIPLIYKNYYTSIGPDRCKANSYNRSELEKELQEQKFDINNISRELDLIFKIGEKYAMKDIKEKLGTIYKSIGYTKTPKATDLGNYYIIKKCKKTKSGIRSECFKIVSKK